MFAFVKRDLRFSKNSSVHEDSRQLSEAEKAFCMTKDLKLFPERISRKKISIEIVGFTIYYGRNNSSSIWPVLLLYSIHLAARLDFFY